MFKTKKTPVSPDDVRTFNDNALAALQKVEDSHLTLFDSLRLAVVNYDMPLSTTVLRELTRISCGTDNEEITKAGIEVIEAVGMTGSAEQPNALPYLRRVAAFALKTDRDQMAAATVAIAVRLVRMGKLEMDDATFASFKKLADIKAERSIVQSYDDERMERYRRRFQKGLTSIFNLLTPTPPQEKQIIKALRELQTVYEDLLISRVEETMKKVKKTQPGLRRLQLSLAAMANPPRYG